MLLIQQMFQFLNVFMVLKFQIPDMLRQFLDLLTHCLDRCSEIIFPLHRLIRGPVGIITVC